MTDCYTYALVVAGKDIATASEQTTLDDIARDQGLTWPEAFIDVRPCGKCRQCKPTAGGSRLQNTGAGWINPGY